MKAAVGGVASVAGGGKFANGAVTGAFAYLTSPQGGVAQDNGVQDAYGQAVGGNQSGTQALHYTTVDGGPFSDNWEVKWDLLQVSRSGGFIVQEINAFNPDGSLLKTYW